MNAGSNFELPPFTVRRSQRARRVRLVVTAHDGLVVVVPMRAHVDAAAVVRNQLVWARRALARIAEKRALHLAGPDALLPHLVEMRALGRVNTVEYRATAATQVRVRQDGDSIVVSGAIDDGLACLNALNGWVHRRAREHLATRLVALAEEHGLAFSAVRVGRQRSRWGSCSARATISLNRNLLFMPPELVDALLLHELAHTRVLDHSERFWRTLAQLDPHALEHRAALKDAGRFVPAWADA